MKIKLPVFIYISIVLLSSIAFFKGKISGEIFDSKKWKHSNLNLEDNWTLRWDMMNSLRNSYKLKGMSKEALIELLGEGNWNAQNAELTYYLGFSKTGINTGTLHLIFDKTGKVLEYYVWQG